MAPTEQDMASPLDSQASPYFTIPVFKTFGPEKSWCLVHEGALAKYPSLKPLFDAKFPGQHIPTSVAHIIIHFLYTGRLEEIPKLGGEDITGSSMGLEGQQPHSNVKETFRVYALVRQLAERYRVHNLEKLARDRMHIISEVLADKVFVDIISDIVALPKEVWGSFEWLGESSVQTLERYFRRRFLSQKLEGDMDPIERQRAIQKIHQALTADKLNAYVPPAKSVFPFTWNGTGFTPRNQAEEPATEPVAVQPKAKITETDDEDTTPQVPASAAETEPAALTPGSAPNKTKAQLKAEKKAQMVWFEPDGKWMTKAERKRRRREIKREKDRTEMVWFEPDGKWITKAERKRRRREIKRERKLEQKKMTMAGQQVGCSASSPKGENKATGSSISLNKGEDAGAVQNQGLEEPSGSLVGQGTTSSNNNNNNGGGGEKVVRKVLLEASETENAGSSDLTDGQMSPNSREWVHVVHEVEE